MNRVTLKKNGKEGAVYWSDNMDIVTVDFPIDSVEKQVEEYISATRTFKIPQSQEIDDYIEVEARPDESDSMMRLGLCTLLANTGVLVDWGK